MNSELKCLSQCATIFQIFGLQYFSVKSLSFKNLLVYPSWKYTIYFVLVLIILLGLMTIYAVLAAHEHLNEKLALRTVLNYLVQKSIIILLIVITCVSLIQSYTSTPQTKLFYLNCFRIARIAKDNFKDPIDHHPFKKKILRYFFGTELFLRILQVILCFFHKNPDHMVGELLATLPLTFLYTTIFKFFFYVMLVNFHLDTSYKIAFEVFEPSSTNTDSVSIIFTPSKPALKLQLKIQNLRIIWPRLPMG